MFIYTYLYLYYYKHVNILHHNYCNCVNVGSINQYLFIYLFISYKLLKFKQSYGTLKLRIRA